MKVAVVVVHTLAYAGAERLRDVDFVTAMIASVGEVVKTPIIYLFWGAFIGAITLVALVPMFMGLFIVMPILGHATWHLYKLVTDIDTKQKTRTF